ncbi:MAG TPA: hypothetical protein VI306_08590 [Pyrinomonadaceae bacterium]
MHEIIQSWIESGQRAILNNWALLPRRVDHLSTAPLMSSGADSMVYYLIDEENQPWVLKKYFPGREPDRVYLESVQYLVPKRRGFEAGYRGQQLWSTSASALGYTDSEFLNWLDGTLIMPQILAPTWAELLALITDGSALLSRVERLLLTQKLSKMIETLEAAGLAHCNLSSTSVMIDALNVEVDLIDWDNLFHASLEMPSNNSGGDDRYAPEFSKTDERETNWRLRADRFALSVLNVELLTASSGLNVEERALPADDKKSERKADRVREALRRSFPAAVAFLDAARSAHDFSDCPSASAWIAFTEEELARSDEAMWDETKADPSENSSLYEVDYQAHFVKLNRSALVKLERNRFVRAPAT